MTKKTNDINIFGVTSIIQVAKLFESDGAKLSSIQIENSTKKFSKGELDLHGSDIFDTDAKVILCVTRDDDTKYHRQWYRLTGYSVSNFDNWKLVSERIEYRYPTGG